MSSQPSPELKSLMFQPRTEEQLAEPMSDAHLHELFGDFPDNMSGHNREWSFFMLQNGLTEYFTSDYITTFARYLGRRAIEVSAAVGQPARIVEVAAGRGVLSLLLNNEFKKNGSDITIGASDDGSWVGRGTGKLLPHVVQEDYTATLNRIDPHIVIAAWMPDDFTPSFRAAGVDEYVLIGSIKGGNRHGSLATWGFDGWENPLPVPAYTQDGYSRQTLNMPPQYYNSMSNETPQSLTISFSKQ